MNPTPPSVNPDPDHSKCNSLRAQMQTCRCIKIYKLQHNAPNHVNPRTANELRFDTALAVLSEDACKEEEYGLGCLVWFERRASRILLRQL